MNRELQEPVSINQQPKKKKKKAQTNTKKADK